MIPLEPIGDQTIGVEVIFACLFSLGSHFAANRELAGLLTPQRSVEVIVNPIFNLLPAQLMLFTTIVNMMWWFASGTHHEHRPAVIAVHMPVVRL